jgi:quercetin dioxygenase-like cupin family protein
MEKEIFRTKPFFRYRNGQFAAFDIPTIIENLKHEPNWKKGELCSVILLKSPALKVLLTIIHEDTEIITYQVSDSTTIQVLEGSLVLYVKDKSIELNEGEILTLDTKAKYSFEAIKETAFLLTLVSEKDFVKG